MIESSKITELTDMGYEYVNADSKGEFILDKDFFRSRGFSVDTPSEVGQMKFKLAECRSKGVDISEYPIWRMYQSKDGTKIPEQLNKFRYRDQKISGKGMVRVFGPDLRRVIYDQKSERDRIKKRSNFRLLSFFLYGDYDAPIRCSKCKINLFDQVDLGQVIPLNGDLHHIGVWKNKSIAKRGTDPSKLLLSCDLFDGNSQKSQDVLSELQQALPLCKNCHNGRHVAMAKRDPETVYGDINDYVLEDWAWALQREENYQEWLDELKVHSYPIQKTRIDIIQSLYLPKHYRLLTSNWVDRHGHSA